MRRTLGQQRRRVALVVLPLAAVFTVLTASEGLWILAVPGGSFFLAQLVIFIRERRRRPPRARARTPVA